MNEHLSLLRRLRLLILPLALASGLAGCGSGEPATASTAADRAAQAAPTGDASAEEVAASKRGDVDCPAPSTPAPAGSPVDDVLGVRPGMPYADATRTVLCSNPLLVITAEPQRGFDFPTFGQTVRQGFSARFAEPRVYKSGREIVQDMEREATARGMNAVRHDMKPGQAKWFVATMGMPGHEKVIGAAREEWFEQGRNPTLDSVQQALVGKYGPIAKHWGSTGDRILVWMFDPRGRPVTETSLLYGRCSGIADPDASINLNPDCGVVIQAQLIGLRQNPDLAERMRVGVVDQAGGYAALTETRDGLAAADARRRAQQVQDASKHAQAPSL